MIPVEKEFLAFEWDEAKRETNILKHGIDFMGAAAALLQPHIEIDPTEMEKSAYLLFARPLPDS